MCFRVLTQHCRRPPKHEISAMAAAGGSSLVMLARVCLFGALFLVAATWAQNTCGGRLTAASGTFTSPGYPAGYKAQSGSCRRLTFTRCRQTFCVANCIWTITAQDYKRIRLTWSNFTFPYEGGRCCPNFLEVRDGASSSAPVIDGWCGNVGVPDPVVSTGNSLYINVSVTQTTSGIAFNASWVTECATQELKTPSGFVASPEFPGTIGEDMKCRWIISVEPGNIIDFTFDVFDVGLGSNANVPCDSEAVTGEVTLYDSETDTDVAGLQAFPLGSFCNRRQKPKPVQTTGRHMTIVFTTKNMDKNLGTDPPLLHRFNGSYTSRKSGDPAEDQRDELLDYGAFTDDQRLGKKSERSGRVEVPILSQQDTSIRLGNQDIDRFFIYRDGRITLVHFEDGDDSKKNYICVYCTDIDHTDHVADVYYKLHNSRDKSDHRAKRITDDVTNEIRKYSPNRRFEAKITLLVSWDKVKSRGNLYEGTATFQAAIVSDYVTTYALVYYEKNSMGWKPKVNQQVHDITFGTGLPGNQTGTVFRPERYSYSEEMLHIDSLKGNTGRKGTWLFELGDVSSTPEQQCRSWRQRNSAQDIRMQRDQGFARLPKCPCSESTIKMTGRWVRVPNSGRPTTVTKRCYTLSRSHSLRHRPYSELCCYDAKGNFVKSSPDAGTCLAFNPTYSSMMESYLKEDWEAYKSCCEQSNMCDAFTELRPIPECMQDFASFAEFDVWRPPPPPPRRPRIRWSFFWGDPHITTFDEVDYTFNGWGEYTLVTLTSPEVSFTVQGRTDLAETADGKLTDATVFTAVGAEGDGTRIFAGLDPETKSTLIVYANGTDYSLQFREKEDFIVDSEDFQLVRDNHSLISTFASGCGVSVTVRMKTLEVSVSVPFAFQNLTQGLLGNFNGFKGDEFILPNGTVLPNNISERQIFHDFGEKWRISEEESVMMYGPREGPSDYQHPTFAPIFLDEQPADVVNAAKEICGSSTNLACLYDYLATGSAEFALDTKQVKDEADLNNNMGRNTIPEIRAPAVLNVTSGERVSFTLQGYDPDKNDALTFHIEDNFSENVQIDPQTGDGTFIADYLVPLMLRVYVQDRYVRSPSSVIPVVMCSGCSGHGVCDFSRSSFSERGNHNFQYARCVCQPAWDGPDCERDRDGCAEDPCIPLQTCTDLTPDQQGDSQVGYDCGPCPEGFLQDPASRDCVDVDECVRDKKCEHNCFNTKGSYICTCNAGYRLDIDGHKCWEIDECLEKLDKCQHICKNTEGSYSCLCEEGYTLDDSGTACAQDTSTASLCEQAGCSQGCRLKPDPDTGSKVPECFCRHGYDLDATDLRTCTDHDECEDGVCPQNCYNYAGGFSCYCYHGYRLSEDKRTCTPCPKWRYGPDCQLTCTCNGRAVDCHPVKGCVCEAGWKGDQCQEDVDECGQVASVCGPGQICVNTRGSYTCNCMEGYTVDSTGSSCEDIDECADLSVLNTCSETEQCVSVPGTFYCQCKPGYRRFNDTCIDIDECADGNHGCEQVCVNVPGIYNCGCFYGYRLNLDRATCSKVSDVCAEEEGLTCAHGCTLSDEDDRAICFCRTGYQLGTDSQSCVDINECIMDTAGCSHTCTNTEGGFFCTCPAGMKLDNDKKTCLDCPSGTFGINCTGICACGIGSERCDAVSGCACATGWQGESCEDDVNECGTERVQQECREKNAECMNYPGRYRCQCQAGYKEDRNGKCQDVDECLSASCDQQCENTPGSYRCLCNKGFTLNSTTGLCQDVDECKLSVTNVCSQRCVNTQGSYYCACDAAGYSLEEDGASCRATTQCTRADCPTTNGGCSQEKCFCNSGYSLTDSNTCEMKDVDWCAVAGCDHNCEETSDGKSFICSCRTGFLLQKDGTSCLECPFGRYGENCNQNCTCEIHNTATCDPVNGACACKAGWEGVTCGDDIDECLTSPEEVSCPDNSHCVNLVGSYLCKCDVGHYKAETGMCLTCTTGFYGENCASSCGCSMNSESCHHVTGACVCRAGWEGEHCDVDVDECMTGQHDCTGDHIVCRNDLGGFHCVCEEEYTPIDSGECVKLKRVRVDFTLEDIDVPAEDLSDPSLPAYAKLSNSVKSAIEQKLRPAISGLLAVEIISLRRGSLIVETDVTVDTTRYPEATQQLALTLVALSNDSLIVQGQEGKVHVTLDGEAVQSSWTACDVYETIQPCSGGERCRVIEALPQCRSSVDTKSEDNTVAIAVGVTVAVLLIIAIVVALFCFLANRKGSRNIGGDYSAVASEDVPMKVQAGPAPETFVTSKKTDTGQSPSEPQTGEPADEQEPAEAQALISKQDLEAGEDTKTKSDEPSVGPV